MTDGKKRAARKTKSKTDNSGQRTLLHHFSRKRTGVGEDGPRFEEQNSSPAAMTDELPALSQRQDSRADPASSDHERPPSSAPSVITIASNGSDKSVPTSPADVRTEAPPKKLFPLFERAPAYKKPISPLHPSVVDLDSEIIDITDDDEAPEHDLVSKSQPSRPTRIFGGSNAPSSSAPASSSRRTLLISTEGTKHEPIVIDASPVRGPIRIFPPPRPNRQPSPAKKLNPNGSKSGMQAPLPDEQTQHARGPQTVFTSGSSHLGVRKEKRPIIDTTDSYASFPWKTLLPKLTYSTNQSDDDLRHPSPSQATAPALESEFDAHRRLYPAISRFFDTDTSPHQGSGAQTQAVDASQQHWNDKWRPRRAEQVLGNERRACYLRDWLSALRLHFDAPAAGPARSQPSSQTSGKGKQTARHKRKAPKRPQILREVKRSQKRRRDDELGWIVDDDDLSDEQPDFEYGSDDDDFLLTPQDAAGPHREGEESPVPSETFTFGDKIHNTILLTGPSGSGKTAAIYACAEELGWEVFEVYAGIGKRGGANLDTLIGDVGKNHLVQRPRLRAEGKRAADAEPVSQLSTQGAFQGFWDAGKKDMGIQRLRRKGIRDGPLEVDEYSNSGTPEAHSQAPMESGDPSASGSQAVTHTGAIGTDDLDLNTTFRQSIVLFEEVDVLFKEDAGFWHAVVKFIKDCKRPVVMTCNDVTLVPTEDLPLQDILTFKPPPRPIVTSFLQGLCLAEGLRVDRQHLEHVLTAEHRTFPHDRVGPDEPSTSHVDLRQCINQCQFGQTAMVSQDHSDTGHEPRDNPLDSLFAVSGLGLERDSGSREEQLRHLDQRERNADSVSQLDAFCVLWDAWVLEASASHADDQNGYNAIRCVTRDNVVATPEYYRQDKEIVQAMIDIGGGAGRSEECARHEGGSYESQMEYALDGNVPRHAFILHRTAVFLEYEPWIRYIVREQMREREAEEERGKKGRQTRNSKRRGDEWVKMSEGQEGVLVRTGLVV